MLKFRDSFFDSHPVSPRSLETRILVEEKNEIIEVPDNWYDFACGCKIRSGTKIVNFIPYDYQKALIDNIESHSTTLIAKTRQLGITETISNYFLWKALANPAYLGVIFSKCQADTSNIAKRLRRQIETLEVTTRTDSLTDIEFCGGGRILFRNSTANGARGLESVSDILFDEASFIDDVEEIYKSAIPCTTMVGDKAKIIINSTPNGQSGWYYDRLMANNGDNSVMDLCDRIKKNTLPPYHAWTDEAGWCKTLIHWKAHPVFSKKETYLEDIEKQFGLTRDQVEQEYNLSFTSADSIVFPPELVYQCATGAKTDNVDKDTHYYFGLDVSGVGNDYTVLSILKSETAGDKESYELVNWYRNRKKSNEFNLVKIMELAEQYTPSGFYIEVNSLGQIYYEQILNLLPYLNIEAFKTTRDSKIGLVTRLLLGLERHVLKFPNKSPHYGEFFDFRCIDGKYEAIAGKHDDCIMSLGLALAATPFKPLLSSSVLDLSRY